jgi:hypothetical protein
VYIFCGGFGFMNKLFLFFVFLFCCSTFVFASNCQTTINVLDKATGNPLSDFNVDCDMYSADGNLTGNMFNVSSSPLVVTEECGKGTRFWITMPFPQWQYSGIDFCKVSKAGYIDNNKGIVLDANYTYDLNLTPLISFSNLQVFEDGNYTASVNLNNASDIVIRWGFTATGADVNTLSAKVYYTTPFDTNNCYGFIRDAKQCGYKAERNTFSVVSQDGNAYTFRSSAEDDHAFKTWFYNGDPDLYETVTQGVTKSDFNITKSDTFVKTLISSVLVDKNISYNLSIDARYTGNGTRTLNIYDCNTDLGVSTPVNNKNCWLDTITTATTKSPDGFYSLLHTSNDLNVINNVKLNVNGNHYIYYTCTGCNLSKYWSIGLIDMNTNIDKPRNWTSTNGINNFVASSKTVDAHYHAVYLTIPKVFRSYFTIDSNAGINYTSGFYDDSISGVNTVPHLDAFISPTTGLYSGVFDVNAEVYDSELNDLVCDFNLVDSSLAFVAEIDSSVSPVGGYCTADFNTLAYTDGNYYVLGRVRESATPELLSASEYSREFEINNAPTINSIIINEGTNLDGVNYDLNANISSATSVTYKCYSGTGGGSGCTSGSWDCKTGSLTNSSGNNWSTSVTGTTKDTNGVWTCKITAGTTSDTNTATMNEIVGITIDSTSMAYALGISPSNNNPGYTNQSKNYIVVTHSGNVTMVLKVSGTALDDSVHTPIAVGKQKFNGTDDSATATALTGSAAQCAPPLARGTYPTSTTQNLYWWLDIPAGQGSGEYTGTLTFGSEKA